jgi:WD40 repeat protein
VSEFNDLSIEKEEYLVNLAYHLTMAGMVDDLYEILTEFDFLDYKNSMTQSQSIIDDFDLALSSNLKFDENRKKTFELIESAVRLSANVIDTDKKQFMQQLWGRLISYKSPEIQNILNSLKSKDTIWLRSLIPSFTQAGGSLLRTLTINNGYANSLSITPDGYIIGALSNGNIKIWQLSSGAEQKTFVGHSGAVNSVTLTTNGKNIISGSEDQTVRVWDFQTGNLIFTLTGHNASVNAVAVTPDNKWIISGAEDGEIKIWNLQTGEENIFGKILFSLSNSTNSIKLFLI